jgi:hypothetical protein
VLFADELSLTSMDDGLLRALTQVAGIHAYLQILRYKAVTGSYPSRLDEMAGLPKDPCSGMAFSYDRSAKRFWSVGTDGEDNGGREKMFNPGLDIVWDLP